MMRRLRHIYLSRVLAAVLVLSTALTAIVPFLVPDAGSVDALAATAAEIAALAEDNAAFSPDETGDLKSLLWDLISRAAADETIRQAILSGSPLVGAASGSPAIAQAEAVRSGNRLVPVVSVVVKDVLLPSFISLLSAAAPLGP